MADIALKQGIAGGYDVALTPDGDLMQDDTLRSAVITSLFTDRRSDNPQDGRTAGHILDDPQDRWGSGLWKYRRAKITEGTAEAVRQDCARALQWLKEDNLASDITVTAEQQGDRIAVSVILKMPDGNNETIAFPDVLSRSEPL